MARVIESEVGGGQNEEVKPMEVFKVRQNDSIFCEKGHRVGRFLRDVLESQAITSDDLEFTDKGLMAPRDGYQCPACGKPVAFFSQSDKVWTVFTASGWRS